MKKCLLAIAMVLALNMNVDRTTKVWRLLFGFVIFGFTML